MNDYKQKYLQMKNMYLDYRELVYNQLGGAIYSDPEMNKSYSGSGIMLFELHKGKPTVILFENHRKNKSLYEDLGGGIDSDELISKDPLKSTAIREAFEESRGLINISNPKHLEIYVDSQYKSKYYRNYLVGIKYEALIDDYNHNKSIIDKNSKMVNTMKETFSIEKFYINDLIKDGIMESIKGLSFLARNIDNKQKNIYTRTVDILQEAISKDVIQKVVNKPIEFVQLKTLTSV